MVKDVIGFVLSVLNWLVGLLMFDCLGMCYIVEWFVYCFIKGGFQVIIISVCVFKFNNLFDKLQCFDVLGYMIGLFDLGIIDEQQMICDSV